MNSLSVLFRDESSSSYFSRKLFEFGAYANSLDHLDCSRGTLAVFYNKIFILGRKFLSHQWRQLLELELVLFLLTIWIPDCLCLAHTVEIRINSTMQATPAGSGVLLQLVNQSHLVPNLCSHWCKSTVCTRGTLSWTEPLPIQKKVRSDPKLLGFVIEHCSFVFVNGHHRDLALKILKQADFTKFPLPIKVKCQLCVGISD